MQNSHFDNHTATESFNDKAKAGQKATKANILEVVLANCGAGGTGARNVANWLTSGCDGNKSLAVEICYDNGLNTLAKAIQNTTPSDIAAALKENAGKKPLKSTLGAIAGLMPHIQPSKPVAKP